MKDSYLTQFVRNRKGNPIGIVVASKMLDCNVVRIGWSYTNVKAGDRFNKERGLGIARDRIHTDTNRKVPHAVLKVLDGGGFVDRSKHYFNASDAQVAGAYLTRTYLKQI